MFQEMLCVELLQQLPHVELLEQLLHVELLGNLLHVDVLQQLLTRLQVCFLTVYEYLFFPIPYCFPRNIFW